MSEPLVSVVIPTVGRPRLLPRAVASALECGAVGDVEVIVVPNGLDTTWRESLAPYAGNQSVIVMPITNGNGNAARNHAMRNARGRFIRFLDDDDLLYGERAAMQYAMLEDSGADVCSGGVDLIGESARVIEVRHPPLAGDFVAATLHALRLAQPTAHVFRREAVIGTLWDEALAYTQDIDWMFRLCAARDLTWVRLDRVVGAWRQHEGSRISKHAPLHKKKQLVANGIVALLDSLALQGRLTEERRHVAVAALWEGVHENLLCNPWFWTAIGRQAMAIEPGSRPDIPLYDYPVMVRLGVSPILWEWLMMPKRLVTRRFGRGMPITGRGSKS